MSEMALDVTPKYSGNAVLYLRVSTEEQVENYSLDTQKAICTKEAEKRHLQVVEIFREEGRSAKTMSGRPELIQMLEYCRKNKRNIDAIIVYRLDRISRQTSDYLAIRKKLSEYDIVLISASEPTGNSPTEKFVETMLAGFAQMDNDVRSERSANGLKARFLNGLAHSVPIGYLKKDGYASKDPEKFDVIKASWERMAVGSTPLREMAEILNKQGVREVIKGKEYSLRPQTLSRIFRNKFYMGRIVSARYNQEVLGQHTPMISEELFYRVQAILDGRMNGTSLPSLKKNHSNPNFPLRRIVKCSICGKGLTGAFSTGKKKPYGYYFCVNRCSGKSSPVAQVEDGMRDYLGSITLETNSIKQLVVQLRKTYYERITGLQKRRDEADVELGKLYQLRQALIEKNLSGIYTDDIFKEQNKLIEEKIAMLNLAKNDAVIKKYNLEAIMDFIRTKYADLAGTFVNSGLEQKRMLLCSIFPSGARWGSGGYSNTQINRFYTISKQIGTGKVPSSAVDGT